MKDASAETTANVPTASVSTANPTAATSVDATRVESVDANRPVDVEKLVCARKNDFDYPLLSIFIVYSFTDVCSVETLKNIMGGHGC